MSSHVRPRAATAAPCDLRFASGASDSYPGGAVDDYRRASESETCRSFALATPPFDRCESESADSSDGYRQVSASDDVAIGHFHHQISSIELHPLPSGSCAARNIARAGLGSSFVHCAATYARSVLEHHTPLAGKAHQRHPGGWSTQNESADDFKEGAIHAAISFEHRSHNKWHRPVGPNSSHIGARTSSLGRMS